MCVCVCLDQSICIMLINSAVLLFAIIIMKIGCECLFNQQ